MPIGENQDFKMVIFQLVLSFIIINGKYFSIKISNKTKKISLFS